MLHRISRGFVLRKLGGRMDGFDRMGMSARGVMAYGAANSGGRMLALTALMALVLIVLAVLMVLSGHTPDLAHGAGMLGLGFAGEVQRKSGTDEKKPANIRKMEADLKALATELEQGQIEMAAGPITPERGEDLEGKAQEMENLQDHIDRYNKIAGITGKARQVGKVTLPHDAEENRNRKSVTTTPGHLFVLSQALQQYKSNGKHGWSAKVDIGRRFGKKARLTGEAAIEFEKKAFDAATLSSLGDDVLIQTDRDPEIVRYEEPEVLTMRDIFNVSNTTSDAIRYVKHTATVRNAQSQATRGGLKPYLHITFAPATVSVETIAVLSKVTEQDVDDAPRLVGYINGEMTLDVKVEEERQLMWGDGTNGNLLGLFDAANAIPEFDRAGTGDTVIDTIRRMRTDLRKKKVQPNFVTIDPLDWEEIELSKGTDDRYIWGLITDIRGPRIWSLRVIESDAMTNAETGERRILVGDGIRGATIYDRNAIQLAVGFVDDDFARNLRTLRAEERLAFAVKRAFAFEYAVTAEAES